MSHIWYVTIKYVTGCFSLNVKCSCSLITMALLYHQPHFFHWLHYVTATNGASIIRPRFLQTTKAVQRIFCGNPLGHIGITYFTFLTAVSDTVRVQLFQPYQWNVLMSKYCPPPLVFVNIAGIFHITGQFYVFHLSPLHCVQTKSIPTLLEQLLNMVGYCIPYCPGCRICPIMKYTLGCEILIATGFHFSQLFFL